MKISMSSVIFGFICVGIGFFFLAGSYYAYLNYTRVQKYSGRASGQVTKKYFQKAADGSGNYYLDYSFADLSGTKIRGSNLVTKQQWDSLKDGDMLEIRYDQSDPNHNIPMQNGGKSIVFAFFIFILGTVFSIFGILRFINGFRRQSKGESRQITTNKACIIL